MELTANIVISPIFRIIKEGIRVGTWSDVAKKIATWTATAKKTITWTKTDKEI